MKVTSATTTSTLGGLRPAERTVPSGFAPEMEAASAPVAAARASALGGVNSLDALLALQETLSPLERKKRALRRGGKILDALDDLKLAMLGEGVDADALTRLQSAVRDARSETDDPGLDDLLEQVEIRAAVELAKREAIAAGMRRT